MLTMTFSNENACEFLSAMNKFFEGEKFIEVFYDEEESTMSIPSVSLHNFYHNIVHQFDPNTPILVINEKYKNNIISLFEGDRITIDKHRMHVFTKYPSDDQVHVYMYWHTYYYPEEYLTKIVSQIKESFMDNIENEYLEFGECRYFDSKHSSRNKLLSDVTQWIYERMDAIINGIIKKKSTGEEYCLGEFYHPGFKRIFDVHIGFKLEDFMEHGMRKYHIWSIKEGFNSTNINDFAKSIILTMFPNLFEEINIIIII